jgi:PAS domain S-box-containing protein
MTPYPPLPRVGASGGSLLRPPVLQPAVRVSAVLAAALVVAACLTSAWIAAGVGAAGLVAAGLANLYLRSVHRELHEALRSRAEWERRYYRLHDSVAVGIFRADPHGRLTGANRGLCTLLGYRSEAELVAADFAQRAYVGPGTFEAVLLRARAQGAVENLEMRLRRFDGLTVTVLATVQAIWDEAGDVTVFEGTVVDLTRERLAESQRRSMERRFRRLFDSSAVGMLVGNLRRGTLEEANPALIELVGLRPSALPVPLERLIPHDQRQLHRSVRAALETHGAAGPLPVEYVRADGVRIPVLVSAAMVDPQHGEFVAVLVDRAAEARAVRGAALLQAFHEAALDKAPTPAATFDGEGRLIRCNHALGELLGGAAEACDALIAGLLGPGCPAPAADAVARALGGEIVRLSLDPQGARAGERLDLTLVPRCGEGVESRGFLAFVTARPAAGAPRAGAPLVTPVTDRPDDDCLEGRRSA